MLFVFLMLLNPGFLNTFMHLYLRLTMESVKHNNLAEVVLFLSRQSVADPELLHPELLHPELLHPELLHPELLHPELLHPHFCHYPVALCFLHNSCVKSLPQVPLVSFVRNIQGCCLSVYKHSGVCLSAYYFEPKPP